MVQKTSVRAIKIKNAAINPFLIFLMCLGFIFIHFNTDGLKNQKSVM